jgi:hypothetical protein
MLREEIMHSIREMARLEITGAIAAGAIYTWLLTHARDITSRLAWFLAPFILVYCAVKVLDLGIRLSKISVYLRRIESLAFSDPSLPGWERYKITSGHRRYDILTSIFAGLGWVVLIAASIFASWHFSK